MKAIICGANQIGYNLAAYLASSDNDVIVIDESVDRITYVQETLDVQAVVGRGSYPDLLETLGASSADLIVAVSPSDEYNIITCQIAANIFNIPLKIAHIRSPQYLNSPWFNKNKLNSLPIDHIISPERQVSQVIFSNLQVPGTMHVINLNNNQIIIVCLQFKENNPLNNVSFTQISQQFPQLVFGVLGIIRGGSLLIPSPQDQIMEGDIVYVVTETEKLSRLLSIFGIHSTPLEKIIIAGGGNVGLYLAEMILKNMPQVDLKIIESNYERAQFIAQTLEESIVLHGNTIDINVLKEANAMGADMFIALTDDDAANILSSLISKNLGSNLATTLVSNMVYPKFLSSLGIDSILNPAFITISTILNFVRLGNIRSVHILQEEIGEIFEAEVISGNRLIGELYSHFNVPGKSVVGGVFRDTIFFLPQSEDCIEENDYIIFLVTSDEGGRIEKHFRHKR